MKARKPAGQSHPFSLSAQWEDYEITYQNGRFGNFGNGWTVAEMDDGETAEYVRHVDLPEGPSGTVLIWPYMAIIRWYQILVGFGLEIELLYAHMQKDTEVKISRILAKETQIYVEIG